MYFLSADYMVFTSENKAVKTKAMDARRKDLQKKLLYLHKCMYDEVQKLGLGCHENEQFITTRITPSPKTGQYNTWLLVRYGKTATELAPFKDIKECGFTKHACLQFGLFEGKGFCIDLFLGRKDGFDRLKIDKTIRKNRAVIEAEIEKLKGYGLQWEITGCEPFVIDTMPASEFCNWLLANDSKGEESFLTIPYGILDENLTTKQIAVEILSKLRLLLPLYNALTQRRTSGH
jgi:hypothetical protein